MKTNEKVPANFIFSKIKFFFFIFLDALCSVGPSYALFPLVTGPGHRILNDEDTLGRVGEEKKGLYV